MIEELKHEKIKVLETVIDDLTKKQSILLSELNNNSLKESKEYWEKSEEYFRTSLAISLMRETQNKFRKQK